MYADIANTELSMTLSTKLQFVIFKYNKFENLPNENFLLIVVCVRITAVSVVDNCFMFVSMPHLTAVPRHVHPSGHSDMSHYFSSSHISVG